MMHPTIGRKVWVWIGKQEPTRHHYTILDDRQALDATVVYVHPDGLHVNLVGTDHVGRLINCQQVYLREPIDGDSHVSMESTVATWMPYQVSAAKAQAVGAAGPVT